MVGLANHHKIGLKNANQFYCLVSSRILERAAKARGITMAGYSWTDDSRASGHGLATRLDTMQRAGHGSSGRMCGTSCDETIAAARAGYS